MMLTVRQRVATLAVAIAAICAAPAAAATRSDPDRSQQWAVRGDGFPGGELPRTVWLMGGVG